MTLGHNFTDGRKTKDDVNENVDYIGVVSQTSRFKSYPETLSKFKIC